MFATGSIIQGENARGKKVTALPILIDFCGNKIQTMLISSSFILVIQRKKPFSACN